MSSLVKFRFICVVAGDNVYATVDKINGDSKRKLYSSNPCIAQHVDETIDTLDAPPVPTRGYTRYFIGVNQQATTIVAKKT